MSQSYMGNIDQLAEAKKRKEILKNSSTAVHYFKTTISLTSSFNFY